LKVNENLIALILIKLANYNNYIKSTKEKLIIHKNIIEIVIKFAFIASN